jgi:Rieske Fe-S protein
MSPARDQFICPCHKGAFDLSGQPVSNAKLGYKNPAPRAMDAVDCRVVQDSSTKEWWVEVQYGQFAQGLGVRVAKT